MDVNTAWRERIVRKILCGLEIRRDQPASRWVTFIATTTMAAPSSISPSRLAPYRSIVVELDHATTEPRSRKSKPARSREREREGEERAVWASSIYESSLESVRSVIPAVKPYSALRFLLPLLVIIGACTSTRESTCAMSNQAAGKAIKRMMPKPSKHWVGDGKTKIANGICAHVSSRGFT